MSTTTKTRTRSITLATLKDHIGIARWRVIWEGAKVYMYRDRWPETENFRHVRSIFGIADCYAGALRIVAAELDKESGS